MSSLLKKTHHAVLKKVMNLLRDGLTDAQAQTFMEAIHEDWEELWYLSLQEKPERIHPRWRNVDDDD